MKIVFASSDKTFSKENTKNYTPNSYVLVCLHFGTEGVVLYLNLIMFV